MGLFYYDYELSILILGPLDFCFSLLIPIIYFKYPPAREHPNLILVLICLTEATLAYHLVILQIFRTINSIRYGEFNGDLLSYAYGWNGILFKSFQYLQQCFVIIWCLELVLTIMKPFTSKRLRVILEILTSIMITSILIYVDKSWIIYFYRRQDSYSPQVQIGTFTALVFYTMFLATIAITIIYLHIFRCATLRTKNKQIMIVKKTFARQQLFMLYVIFIVWFIPTMVAVIHPDYLTFDLFAGFILIEIQGRFCNSDQFLGILLCGVRMIDPYFRKKTFQMLFQVCRRRKPQEVSEIKMIDDWNVPLTNLITMVASQEIIGVILLGVCKMVENDDNFQDTEDIQGTKNFKRSYLDKRQNALNCQEMKSSLNTSLETASQAQLMEQNSHAEFIEYAPQIFVQLRKVANLSKDILLDSLSIVNNAKSIENLCESMGQSGAFFFFSQDRQFIIKTITEEELSFLLHKLLPSYHEHILHNSTSLLARIYGCYTVQIENVSAIHMVLMENSFHALGSPSKVFDLKGSLVARRSHNFVKKDLDFLESDTPLVVLEQGIRNQLMEAIRLDSQFLMNCNIMDYSILMGVKELDNMFESRTLTTQFTRCLVQGQLAYSFSIIDFLQEFNMNKYLESQYKSLFNKTTEISSVDPQQYSDRFISFLNQVIIQAIKY